MGASPSKDRDAGLRSYFNNSREVGVTLGHSEEYAFPSLYSVPDDASPHDPVEPDWPGTDWRSH